MMQVLPALHHQKPQVLSYMRWRSIRLMPVELFFSGFAYFPCRSAIEVWTWRILINSSSIDGGAARFGFPRAAPWLTAT